MAKVDYPASAAQIVELVGGTANINKVTHCVTRVRFILKDPSIASANADAVKAVPGVLQVVEAGGQYQVVIGTTVEQMYDEVVKIAGNAGGEVAADDGQDDAPAEKGNIFNRFIKMMALSTALTNAFGVSEPGLFGIVLQHKETMFALMIGAGITGFIPPLMGTAAYSMGASGLFGLPMYMNPDGSMGSFLGAVITNVAAFIVCFLVTYFWPGFDPDKA